MGQKKEFWSSSLCLDLFTLFLTGQKCSWPTLLSAWCWWWTVIQRASPQRRCVVSSFKGQAHRGGVSLLSSRGQAHRGSVSLLSSRGQAHRGSVSLLSSRGQAHRGSVSLLSSRGQAHRGSVSLLSSRGQAHRGGVWLVLMIDSLLSSKGQTHRGTEGAENASVWRNGDAGLYTWCWRLAEIGGEGSRTG